MSQATSTGQTKARVEILRTQLGRARGLGTARSGTAHWWAERVTSVALVPLTLWFVWLVFRLSGTPRAHVAQVVGHPINAALMLALVLATFHHTQLGLQVVIEDYVHGERARMASLLAIKGAAALLALISVVAVLRLTFTG